MSKLLFDTTKKVRKLFEMEETIADSSQNVIKTASSDSLLEAIKNTRAKYKEVPGDVVHMSINYGRGNIDLSQDFNTKYYIYSDIANNQTVVIPALKHGKNLSEQLGTASYDEAVKAYQLGGKYYAKFDGVDLPTSGNTPAGKPSAFSTAVNSAVGKVEEKTATQRAEEYIEKLQGRDKTQLEVFEEGVERLKKAETEKAVKRFEELHGEASDTFIGSMGLAVESGANIFLTGIGNIATSGKSSTNFIHDAFQEVASQERSEMGKVTGFLYDAVSSFTANIPSIIASATLGKLMGAAITFASSYGNDLKYAKDNGHDDKSAMTYAFFDGLNQAFLDYAASALPKVGKLPEALKETISKNVTKAAARFLLRVGVSGASEGLQEMVQTSIENGLKNSILGENNDASMFSEEALYAGMLGTFTASVTGGIETVVDEKTHVRYSVPSKYTGSDTEAIQWAANAFKKQKSTAAVKGLGTVSIDTTAATSAIDNAKTPDQALALVALNKSLRLGKAVTADGADTARITTPVALNGKGHLLTAYATKTADGKYTVSDVLLDGDVIYDGAVQASDSGIVEDIQEFRMGAKKTDSPIVEKTYIGMEEFANSESPVWKNVDYNDNATKTSIMQETHASMVEEGAVVTVPNSTINQVGESFPDLRSVKKEERVPLLKDAVTKVTENLRQFLKGFRQTRFEFNVNGKVLEAKLYSTGINEVLEKITQQKANMLYSTKEIFQNARYLYSTPDYDGDPNVYRWNYFYTPVQIGKDIVGVRIAVRDMASPAESQIYNWGIKKDTSLDGVGRGANARISHDVSSDASSNSRVAHNPPTVNNNYTQNSAENTDPDIMESRSHGAPAEQWQAENVNEGSEAEAKSINTIIKDIEDQFGIPISVGNVPSDRASGTFNTQTEAIRIKVDNALPEVSHELGHYFDLHYKILSLPSVQEAVDIMQKRTPKFASLYGPHQQKTEAVAEFVREYLRDRTACKQQYPQFFAEFISTLSTEDLTKLNSIADSVNAYMHSSVRERIALAVTDRETMRKNREPWYKRLISFLQNHVADEANPIKNVSEKAYRYFYLAKQSSTVAERILTKGGMTDINGDAVEGWEDVTLKSILAPIGKGDYKSFGDYLVARHAVEWLEQGKQVYGDASIDTPDVQKKAVAEYEAEHPEFKEVADRLYQWQKQLMQTWCVDTGMMTQELFDSLWQQYPCYVPFQRAVQSELKRKGTSGVANQTGVVKKAKGSAKQILDPIESIVLRTEQMIEEAKKDRVMQVLTQDVENKDIASTVMERVSLVDQQALNEILENELSNTDADTSTDALPQEVANKLVKHSITKGGVEYVWTVVNGERIYYQVHDTELLNALKAMTPKQMGVVTRLFGTITRVFKATTTGFNLSFGLTKNIFRDFYSGFLYGSSHNPFSYTKEYVSAFRDVLQNRESLREARNAGLGYTSRVAVPKRTTEILVELGKSQEGTAMLRTTFENALHFIESINEVVEMAPRLAEYKRSREAGKNKQESVYDALEVTQNFSKGTALTRQIDAFFPFFNVSVQGLNKFFNTLSTPGKRGPLITKMVTSSVLTALVVLSWNFLVGGEDEYEKLSEYNKNNYYCFYIGNGKFIRIAKARELAVLESLLERVGETFFYGNELDKHTVEEFMGYIFENFTVPGTPDIPALFQGDLAGFGKGAFNDMIVAGPFADILANENFAGVPIVPKSYKELANELQYDNQTSAVAKWLGKLLNLSPMQIDHFMVSNTGFVGKAIKAWTAEDKDFTGGLGLNLISDYAYSNNVTSRFYDELEDAEMMARSYPDDAECVEKSKRYSSAGSVLSVYNRMARENPEMEREYKLLAIAYASEFLEGNAQGGEALNKLYEATKNKDIYPYISFTNEYTVTEKDEGGNSTKVKKVMTADEFLEYVDTYNVTISGVYADILNGISDNDVAAKALVKAKDEIKTYARDTSKGADVLTAQKAGISPALYYQIKVTASTDGNSSISQDEAKAALEKTELTTKQKAIMWTLIDSTWKSNPYKKRYY